MTQAQHAAGVAIVAVLLLATYAPHVSTADFVYEDAVWHAASRGSLLSARGLTRWSWDFQRAFLPSPQAYHAVNLGLFAGLLALTGLVASRLGLTPHGAYAVTGVLAVHPGAVESAAYAAARPELLAALGVMGACLASLCETRWRWLLVTGAILLGLGGKETALVALLLIPLVRWAVDRPLSWWYALVPLTATTGMMTAYGGWLRVVNYAEIEPLAWSTWLLLQSAAAYRLIGVALSGTGMTLDADIDRIPLTAQYLSLVALSGIALLAWLIRRSHPLASVGVAGYVICLVPRLLVQTPRSYLNDHQHLMHLVFLTIAGVSVWDRWQAKDA